MEAASLIDFLNGRTAHKATRRLVLKTTGKGISG